MYTEVKKVEHIDRDSLLDIMNFKILLNLLYLVSLSLSLNKEYK